MIGNAIHSDTTSMEGEDAENKDSNDKYNPNSYIEFPLRQFECCKKQRRTDPKTNFTQIRQRSLQLSEESNRECILSKMIASFPNNKDDEHHMRAEQTKSNSDDDWTKSQEAIEVSCKEQIIGPHTIRCDVATTTSYDNCKSCKHAKRKQKRHQSDVSTESDCISNQTFDTNISDQRKTQKNTNSATTKTTKLTSY